MGEFMGNYINNYFLLFDSKYNFTNPTTKNITTININKYPYLRTVIEGLFTLT